MSRALRPIAISIVALSLLTFPALEGDVEVDGSNGDVSSRTVDLAFAAEGRGAWVSTPLEGETTVTGLSWDEPGDAPEEAEFRVQVDGEWRDWEPLPVDDDHLPDDDTEEAANQRGASAPIVVAGAEAVQFRINDDEAPQGLEASVITAEDPSARSRTVPAADAAPSRPTIRTRADWNADSCVRRDPSSYNYADRVEVLFVHHTVNGNSYSQSQVPGIIRSICSYHVNSNGWDDIGYNALIDRFGGIWEGRAGGIDKGVQGAHTGGFNNWSTGVAFIGDHHNGGAPTTAAQTSFSRYAAWKMDQHNIDPMGSVRIRSAGNSKHREGSTPLFGRITGHREASYTACPGNNCAALLPTFRTATDAIGTQSGVRIFGGYAVPHTIAGSHSDGWGTVTFPFELTSARNWAFEIRDNTGRVVHSRTGSGSGGTIGWDGRIGGQNASPGSYTSRLTAGSGVTPSVHEFVLGSRTGEFNDVGTSNVFRDDIRWIAIEGITRGCNPPANDRYCPGDPVTRDQMAAFLVRALNLPAGNHPGFVDVPAGSTFDSDIRRLAAAGITRGCNPPTNNRYCPGDPVTREQMAAFLKRGLPS